MEDLFIVVKTEATTLDNKILNVFKTHETAIEYLTEYIDNNYERSRWLNIYHESRNTISIYNVGYTGKTLDCKLHILWYSTQ